MEQTEMLRYAAENLDRLGIPYFVTGSYAGVLYGEVRMTIDIDIVIDLKKDQIDGFMEVFPDNRFYIDREAVIHAVKTGFQFNVLDRGSVGKIDFIVGGRSSHGRKEFERLKRVRGTVDYEIAYCAPEDLILHKLQFHSESGSDKHLRDVAGILKKTGSQLDFHYLEQWVDWLDVFGSWRKAKLLAGLVA